LVPIQSSMLRHFRTNSEEWVTNTHIMQYLDNDEQLINNTHVNHRLISNNRYKSNPNGKHTDNQNRNSCSQ